MPAPIPIRPSSIHSSRMAFSRRWRMRARSAAARAGRRAISCSRTRQAKIVGCAPCYLKSHSQGEYVFDHSWADAYDRAGGQLLPEAADRRAVHAGAGAAPAGAAGARRRGEGGAAGGRRDGPGRAQPAVGAARHLPERRRMEPARGPQLPQAHRPAVPLEQCGLRHLRRFPGLARLAQAQGRAQGARGGTRPPVLPSNGRAAATSPRRTGTRSSPSTWTRARASGGGPISTARPSR